ncbi:hypothetical protein QCA50_013277 [Cerrena zonata]|uniref:ASTRA-associated protein 1 n=1 Tax=Cerrena zonata TaxID=2478898 RepID=A0AAW0FQ79_9APHY
MSSSPNPIHLLRPHSSRINALWFSEDNERLYSGDTSGMVIITSTRTLRSIASWKAHDEGILGIQEWDDSVLTHGRDNKLHVWTLLRETAAHVRDAASQPGLPTPSLRYSMDVNALNYCRFSLMPLPTLQNEERSALIALPNLIESSLADVWELPSQKRLHAAIGRDGKNEMPSIDGRGTGSTGIIMSMHLFSSPHLDHPNRTCLKLLCAYENGGIELREFTRTDKGTSVEGIGWEVIWRSNLHVESIMAMAVSRDHSLALTVSADHIIGRHDILKAEETKGSEGCVVHRTKYAGNASIAIRDDGKVCAVGGWDGKIRLYSTKSFKPLGTLDYHKKSCQTLAFTHPSGIVQLKPSDTEEYDSEDEMLPEEQEARGRWLAAGSEDNRISIWPLITFGRQS